MIAQGMLLGAAGTLLAVLAVEDRFPRVAAGLGVAQAPLWAAAAIAADVLPLLLLAVGLAVHFGGRLLAIGQQGQEEEYPGLGLETEQVVGETVRARFSADVHGRAGRVEVAMPKEQQ